MRDAVGSAATAGEGYRVSEVCTLWTVQLCGRNYFQISQKIVKHKRLLSLISCISSSCPTTRHKSIKHNAYGWGIIHFISTIYGEHGPKCLCNRVKQWTENVKYAGTGESRRGEHMLSSGTEWPGKVKQDLQVRPQTHTQILADGRGKAVRRKEDKRLKGEPDATFLFVCAKWV